MADITRLHRQKVHDCFLTQTGFDAGNEVKQRNGSTAPNVVHPPWGRAGSGVGGVGIPVGIGGRGCVQCSKNTLDHIVDVGEVSSLLTFAEHWYGLVLQDGIDKSKQRHVWSAPRPIDRKKSESCTGDAIEVGVDMGHVLVGLFGGGVQGDWVVNVVPYGEGQVLIAAIDAGTGCVHQVFDVVVATSFEYGQESIEVGFKVCKRVVK